MYSIRIQDCGHEFACRPGQTLLEATRQRGARCIRSGCLGGGCGVCKIRVLSGGYTVGKMSRGHVRVEAEARGFALACKVTPQSDLVVEAMCNGHETQAMPWQFRRPDEPNSGGE
jgi:ferredoxin